MAGGAVDRVPVPDMAGTGMGETGARAIVCDHHITLSEWERSSRARNQTVWPTRFGPDWTLELVRELCSPPYGLSLIGMLPDLAMWCPYGDLVRQVTTVKPCDLMCVPVPSAAPGRSCAELTIEVALVSLHGIHR